MSISKIIKKFHQNRVESIKKMPNGYQKDMAIGSLVADLGKRSIKPVAIAIGSCFRKVKKCFKAFIYGVQTKIEFRGRKKKEDEYPNLIPQIKEIVSKYERTDSHFKTEVLYVDLTSNTLIKELINQYGYEDNFISENTIRRIMKKLGYKLRKIKKSEVAGKVPETDMIFENVHETLKAITLSDASVAAISIDDKTKKKIGKIAEPGKSYIPRNALDHDTFFDYNVTPFGILDLKTNETFVHCTVYNSTAEYKVDCIENYIKYKNTMTTLKKIIIFLDNGPENASNRRLWLVKLTNLAIKYNIVIQLVYYPPYHSKYNKIERYWARLQKSWSGLIIDRLDNLLVTIGRVTWNGVNSRAFLNLDYYAKGISISDEEIKKIEKNHIIREEGIEKWSLIITP